MKLTATPDPANGRILVTLDPEGVSVDGLTRQDANGTTAVRVPAGTFPRTGVLDLADYEAALRGDVLYSAGSTSSGLVTLDGTVSPWLVAPLRPELSVRLETVLDYAAERASLTVEHRVPDRPDPLLALGRLGARTGSLAIWCADHATARAREDVIDRAGVLFLKAPQPGAFDLYFSPRRTAIAADGRRFILTVEYQETIRPVSPITSGSWTFADLAASYGSFSALTSSYDDFEGLRVNDQTGVL